MPSCSDLCQRFHHHCISPQDSNNTYIPQIVNLGKCINDSYKSRFKECCIAIQYGKRLIITGKDVNISLMSREDIIEIVDVDPVKNTILYLGQLLPYDLTPLLFMLSYAKKEVQYIIAINMKNDIHQIDKNNKIPIISDEKTFLDLLKSILTKLTTNNMIILDNTILIMIAKTYIQMEKMIDKVSEYEN